MNLRRKIRTEVLDLHRYFRKIDIDINRVREALKDLNIGEAKEYLKDIQSFIEDIEHRSDPMIQLIDDNVKDNEEIP